MTNYLTYKEIAEELNVSIDTVRRNVRNYLDELEIIPEKRKTSQSKGALVDCLTYKDAEIFISFYKSKIDSTGNGLDNVQVNGTFYIIQLIPEFNPDRVKLGYADNIEKRLKEHQTASPTAKLIKSWNCKRYWELAAIDSITREGCKFVMNEVYEGNIDEMIKRADEFFTIMPEQSSNVELSEYSPLRKK